MCDPRRSCAVVTDEGFTSGFIIAHEIAHVIGLEHDDQENGCWGPAFSSAIMTPMVESKFNRFSWSPCSRQRIREVIDYLFCLEDNPDIDSALDDHYALDTGPELSEDMGRQWSLNFQCRLEFGHGSRLCSAFRDESCNVLWCTDGSSPYLCRTKRGPPVPGSSCGYAMECRNRHCVYVGREKRVDGGWSDWGEWGDCSVLCGMGIRRRRRFCSNPRPLYGGRPCPGEAEAWDTCVNYKDCEEHYDLRATQCAAWNEMNVRIGQHDWKPYPAKTEREKCFQTCVSSSTGEVLTLRTPALDSVPCDYNASGICFHGKCLKVGCDGVQNSNKTFDACGVCDGDHSQCQTVSGHLTRQPATETEYEPVVFLPKGSRHIEVINRGKASHFIALRNAQDGSYALNGNGKREESRVFVVGGALFEYERKFGYQAVRTAGPTYINLEVMLYPAYDLSNASVRYEYSVNKRDTSLQRHKYRWLQRGRSPCSVSCGQGVETAVHVCYDRDSGEERSDNTCQYLDPPDADALPCTLQACVQKRYVWTLTPGQWSACNATRCSEDGWQAQAFQCQAHFAHNDTYLIVDPSLCDHQSQPSVTRPCSTPVCGLTWSVGEWSECSVTCGRGIQRRSAHCADPLTDSDDLWCQDDHPALSRLCRMGPCNDILDQSLNLGSSDCQDVLSICSEPEDLSRKCRTRRFQTLCCQSCRKRQSPLDADPRSLLPLKSIYRWVLIKNLWSKCSAKGCGEEGQERQQYRCQQFFHRSSHASSSSSFSSTRTAAPHHCGDPLSAPRVTRKCQAPPCGLQWSVGEWSQCSVTCGRGLQRRSAHCADPLTDSDDLWCQDDPPALSRLCRMGPCNGLKKKKKKAGCLDKYTFCRHALGLSLKCQSKGFRRMCCHTCRKVRRVAHKQARRSHKGAPDKAANKTIQERESVKNKWRAQKHKKNESLRRKRMRRLQRARKRGASKTGSASRQEKPVAVKRTSPSSSSVAAAAAAEKSAKDKLRQHSSSNQGKTTEQVPAAVEVQGSSQQANARKPESKLEARIRIMTERHAARRKAAKAKQLSSEADKANVPAADAPSDWDLYRQRIFRQ